MKMKREHVLRLITIGLLVCATVAIILRFAFAPQYDYPPMIVVDGTTYQGTNRKLEQLPQDSIYLGEVRSSVPSSVVPTENFQANDERTGAPIYQVGEEIVIFHSDLWWIYRKIEQS